MPESTKGQVQPGASVDGAILCLGTKKSWRLTDLPDWIGNAAMLRRLDGMNCIWVRSRTLRDYPVDDPFGWYSPRKRDESWEPLIARVGSDPERAPDIKLSNHGKDTLEDLQQHGGQGGARAGESQSWFGRVSENVIAQVIALVVGLVLVGIAYWKWPWIKELLV
jgi:hypothetical protein